MKSTRPRRALLSALALTLMTGTTLAQQARIYFGTYTREGGSQGIYYSNFEEETGRLQDPVLVAEIANPTFLTFSPDGKTLYAVSEVSNVDGGGTVSAYQVLESGQLELINRQASGGAGPCHVSISSDGRFLAVANYGGGSVASYRVAEDGSLSEPVSVIQHEGSSVNPDRQKRPHAHSINFSPDNRFAYAADLGTDRIYIYSVEGETGKLAPAGETAVAPGSGPRHFTFHPEAGFAYVINELTHQVAAFTVDRESGALSQIQSISTLPEGTDPVGSTAEVVSHPSGRFLYGSNRGHDSIVVYQIDPSSGRLSHVENEPIRGKTPRNFVLSPGGNWLLAGGQQSDNVTVFSVDAETGKLEFADKEIKLGSPVCIRFQPRP
jgi:6-phosphogluconolactonase